MSSCDRNQNHKKICNPPYHYLPTREKFAPPHASPNLTQNLLSDRLWVPLLYVLMQLEFWLGVGLLECKTFYINSLGAKLIMSCKEVPR